MKLKVGNLVAAFQSGALTRLANSALPIKTASQLKSVLTQAQEAMKEYDTTRIASCERYGRLNETSGDYEFVNDEGQHDPEKFKAFQAEADDLLQKEITFIGQPFSLSHFYSSHSITANDLMILDWLINIEVNVNAAGTH